MATWIVRAEGPYLVLPSGREIFVDGAIPLVMVGGTLDGMLILRVPPRDVTVESPFDPTLYYDMTDIPRLVVAVVKGGLTVAQINAVRPAVATAVQTFMTNHGLVAGSVP